MDYGEYDLKLVIARCANGETREYRLVAVPETRIGMPVLLANSYGHGDDKAAVCALLREGNVLR